MAINKSLRMAGLAAYWSALALVFYIIQTVSIVSAGYELFPPKNITNPVEFVNFGTGSVANEIVQADIGRMLNNRNVHAMFLACSLEWMGTKYLPIPSGCSNSDASSVEDMENGTANLYFVYGRPGGFTRTFLRLPAPNRYFSLTFLGGRVSYLGKDKTLNLRIRNDSVSQEIWMNSSTDLRKSFIHRMVNKTLTESLKRVDFATEWLNGSIYTRTNDIRNSTESAGLPFPLFFGKVYRYEECDRSLFPLDIELRTEYLEGYSYTVCSSWEYFDLEHHGIVKFWYATVWTQWIFLGLLSAIGYLKYWHIFDFEENPGEGEESKPPARMKIGEFPEALTVSCVFLHRSPDRVAHLRSLFFFSLHVISMYVVPWIYYGLLFQAPYALYNQLYLLEGSGISERNEDCWKPDPVYDPLKAFIVCIVFTYCYWPLYAVEVDVCKCCASCYDDILIGLNRIVLLVYVFSNVLFLVNIIPIVIFTVVGLLISHTSISLITLTLLKIIVFDIFKITKINAAVSPKIALCKEALDAALQDLRSTAVRRLDESITLSHASVTAMQDTYSALIKNEEVVLLLLCKQFILAKESTQIPYSEVRDAASLATQRSVKDALFKKVRVCFWKHVGFSFVLSLMVIAILGSAQILLVHIGEIAELEFPLEVIIPAVTAISTFLSAFTGGNNNKENDRHKLASAKEYLLILSRITESPDLSVISESQTHYVHTDPSSPSPQNEVRPSPPPHPMRLPPSPQHNLSEGIPMQALGRAAGAGPDVIYPNPSLSSPETVLRSPPPRPEPPSRSRLNPSTNGTA